MKKILYSITAVLLLLAGCAEFTDIQPKGKNILSKAEDLDQLLNYDYPSFGTPATLNLTNVAYSRNLPALYAEPVKTTSYAQTFWDESVDRAILTESDVTYQEIYKIAGTICNPVIARADAVSGSRNLADRVKAEAYGMRAWVHYLAVNLYAKAYDPATAAETPGVPYSFETDLMSQPNKKYTVQEVYDFILADLDAALALNALPENGVNRMRVGKSFVYAVQAKVLMSMHKYGDALTAARSALAINDHIDNHNDMLVQMASYTKGNPDVMIWQRPYLSSNEDIFAVYTTMLLNGFSPEIIANFDPASVLLNHMPTFQNAEYSALDISNYYFGVPGLQTWMSFYNAATFSGAGFTTVDMMLVEAECLMREGQLAQAMEKIEHIRRHRIITDRYEVLPIPSTKAGVFAVVKQWYRSENFFTFKDFIDLKRWNTETEYVATLRREILDREFTLSPGSPLWIFPFPQTATNFNPNLTQNY